MPVVRCALVVLAAAVLPATTALAQAPEFAFTDTSLIFEEDFDLLEADESAGTSAFVNADTAGHTLDYWYAAYESGGTPMILPDDGGSTDVSLRSFGDDGDSDRALGTQASSASESTMVVALKMTNDTSVDIHELHIRLTMEIWRRTTNVSSISFNMLDADGDDTSGLQTSDVSGADTLFSTVLFVEGDEGPLDGNDPENRVEYAFSHPCDIQPGHDFWLLLRANAFADPSHGWGIDDLMIRAERDNGKAAILNENFDSYAADSDIADETENPDTPWNGTGADGLMTDDAGRVTYDWDSGSGNFSKRFLPVETDITNDGADPIVYASTRFILQTDNADTTTDTLIFGLLEDVVGALGLEVAAIWLRRDGAGNWTFGISGPDYAVTYGTGNLGSYTLATGVEYVLVLRVEFLTGGDTYDIDLAINPGDTFGDNDAQGTIAGYDPPSGLEIDSVVLENFGAEGLDATATLDNVRVSPDYAGVRQVAYVDITADHPDDSEAAPEATEVLVGRFDLTPDSEPAGAVLDTLTLAAHGTGNSDSDVADVAVWLDDGDGLLDNGSDVMLANGPYDNGTVTLATNQALNADGATLLVTYNFADFASNGDTYSFQVVDDSMTNSLSDNLPQTSALITGNVNAGSGNNANGNGNGNNSNGNGNNGTGQDVSDDGDNGGGSLPLILALLAGAIGLATARRISGETDT